MPDRISDFDAQDSGIREIRVQDLVAGAANTAAQSFDPKKISIGVLLGERGEVGAVTAAQIHFDRSRARKNFGQRQWTKIVFRDEFNGRGSAGNLAVSSHLFR